MWPWVSILGVQSNPQGRPKKIAREIIYYKQIQVPCSKPSSTTSTTRYSFGSDLWILRLDSVWIAASHCVLNHLTGCCKPLTIFRINHTQDHRTPPCLRTRRYQALTWPLMPKWGSPVLWMFQDVSTMKCDETSWSGINVACIGGSAFPQVRDTGGKKNIGAIKGSTHDGLQNFGQNAFGVEFLGGTTTIEHKLSKMIFYMKNLNLKPSHLTWWRGDMVVPCCWLDPKSWIMNV